MKELIVGILVIAIAIAWIAVGAIAVCQFYQAETTIEVVRTGFVVMGWLLFSILNRLKT